MPVYLMLRARVFVCLCVCVYRFVEIEECKLCEKRSELYQRRGAIQIDIIIIIIIIIKVLSVWFLTHV